MCGICAQKYILTCRYDVSNPHTDTYSLIHCTHDYFIQATGWSVSLYDEPFSSYAPFPEKYTKWPQITLTTSKSKIPICMLHTPQGPIFVHFTLQWAVFKLRPDVWKSVPKWPWHVHGKNTNMDATYTPRGLYFHLFHSTMSHFWVTAQFLESALNDPQITLTCYQHVCYTWPQGPDFHPFRYAMSRSWVTAQF